MDNQLYALKSFNHQNEQDGYLLFQNEEKGKNFLEFLNNMKANKNNDKPGRYEAHGVVTVEPYIFEKLKTHSNFFVRRLMP